MSKPSPSPTRSETKPPKQAASKAEGATSVALTPVKSADFHKVDQALDAATPRLFQKGSKALAPLPIEQLEDAIRSGLAATEEHRRQSAIWDLRTGVLFHLYKESLNVRGRKYTGFWTMAEEKFQCGRATVSRKMRLAAVWAKEIGADEQTLQALAAASDFTAGGDNPAVQLALDWIGEATTSDLYRKHKLVNGGPQGGYRGTKADGSERAKKRTKAEIEREEFENASHAALAKLKTAMEHVAGLRLPGAKNAEARAWDILDDKALDALKLAAHDLQEGCLAAQKRRAQLRVSLNGLKTLDRAA